MPRFGIAFHQRLEGRQPLCGKLGQQAGNVAQTAARPDSEARRYGGTIDGEHVVASNQEVADVKVALPQAGVVQLGKHNDESFHVLRGRWPRVGDMFESEDAGATATSGAQRFRRADSRVPERRDTGAFAPQVPRRPRSEKGLEHGITSVQLRPHDQAATGLGAQHLRAHEPPRTPTEIGVESKRQPRRATNVREARDARDVAHVLAPGARQRDSLGGSLGPQPFGASLYTPPETALPTHGLGGAHTGVRSHEAEEIVTCEVRGLRRVEQGCKVSSAPALADPSANPGAMQVDHREFHLARVQLRLVGEQVTDIVIPVIDPGRVHGGGQPTRGNDDTTLEVRIGWVRRPGVAEIFETGKALQGIADHERTAFGRVQTQFAEGGDLGGGHTLVA